jgi:hypothetical protein
MMSRESITRKHTLLQAFYNNTAIEKRDLVGASLRVDYHSGYFKSIKADLLLCTDRRVENCFTVE